MFVEQLFQSIENDERRLYRNINSHGKYVQNA